MVLAEAGGTKRGRPIAEANSCSANSTVIVTITGTFTITSIITIHY